MPRQTEPALRALEFENVYGYGDPVLPEELAQSGGAVGAHLQVVELSDPGCICHELEMSVCEGRRFDGAGEELVGFWDSGSLLST